MNNVFGIWIKCESLDENKMVRLIVDYTNFKWVLINFGLGVLNDLKVFYYYKILTVKIINMFNNLILRLQCTTLPPLFISDRNPHL